MILFQPPLFRSYPNLVWGVGDVELFGWTYTLDFWGVLRGKISMLVAGGNFLNGCGWTFFSFKIVPVVSGSIYLSIYLSILSTGAFPPHKNKNKSPQAFSHQRDTTPAMRSPTAFNWGGTFCSTMPQVLRLEMEAIGLNVSNAQDPYDIPWKYWLIHRDPGSL